MEVFVPGSQFSVWKSWKVSHVTCARVHQLFILGMVIPPLIGNPYNGYKNPLLSGWWPSHITWKWWDFRPQHIYSRYSSMIQQVVWICFFFGHSQSPFLTAGSTARQCGKPRSCKWGPSMDDMTCQMRSFSPKMIWSEVYGDVRGPDVFLFCFDGTYGSKCPNIWRMSPTNSMMKRTLQWLQEIKWLRGICNHSFVGWTMVGWLKNRKHYGRTWDSLHLP